MLIPTLSTTLPVVKSLPECASFSQTVSPYIPQLYNLPHQLLAHYNDVPALKHLYLTTNPLITAFAFANFILAPTALIAGEVNNNYSQVDRVWSIIPVLFNCHYALWAHLNGLPTTRLDHVMALTILWGARLTFNYWRKGGYQIGSEDYRWVVVRKYAGRWMFLFNVIFISFAQSLLLFLITTPTYILLLTSLVPSSPQTSNLDTYDSIFSKLIFSLIILETLADQSQWSFHRAKSHYQRHARVDPKYNYTRDQLDLGFNTAGLFAISRHPNFLAEQAIWVSLYQWACCASYTWVNWTVAGAAGYLALFQGSTAFTEMITRGKYPMYAVYQRRVGKFLPWGRTRGMGEPLNKEEKRVLEEAERKIEAQRQREKESEGGKVGKGNGKERRK
ncbi:DUF1295-domain-containing protein [Westerdykella ornata]|uniref:DUF1295-domain-containing protein n=1 Tax=Westerdykella ornata TaxID=318751 RepID=A0A6A6JGY6_WESOR|nr:DUF1295-domain-containing protein [Westerdykella ornata]KAF2275454.1 DUF1295-domain-containing protein [Westerdykella ornata]